MIDSKLIAVIIVLLIIFAGIVLFLFNLDRRIARLEKDQNKDQSSGSSNKSNVT